MGRTPVTDNTLLTDTTIVTCVFLGIFFIRLFVAFFQNINWDEFHFLSLIYQHQSGTLANPTQTLHVYLFSWLTALPGNEVQQILFARLCVLLLSTVTLFILYNLAKEITSKTAAIFLIICLSSFSFFLGHGASFRADPLLAFCLVLSLYITYTSQPSTLNLFALSLLQAIGLLISIKYALLSPLILGVALSRSITGEKGFTGFWLYLKFLIITACITFSLFLLHKSTLSIVEGSTAPIVKSYGHTIKTQDLFPRYWTIRKAFLIFNKSQFYLLIAGLLISLVYIFIEREHRVKHLLIIFLTLYPMTILVYYRNAFPYFLCLLTLTSLSIAYVYKIIDDYITSPLKLLVPILIGIGLAPHIYINGIAKPIHTNWHYQDQVLAIIHQMFPSPTPYIDGSSMVSSFPKTGFFMSSWGLEAYRSRNRPIFDSMISSTQPKFLIANTSSSVLTQVFKSEDGLLPEDIVSLRDNFVHHWGPIYVAGKQDKVAPNSEKLLEVKIPGIYTLEAIGPLYVNDKLIEPGGQVHLSQGLNLVKGLSEKIFFTFRYGENIYRPELAPLSESVYTGF